MLPRTFHGWVAALAVSLCAPATPAAAQAVTVWENLHVTQILVNNMDATSVVLDFDGRVCANEGEAKVAYIDRGPPAYSFLVSIAMAALTSNRRVRVQTLDLGGEWCRVESITLLK